MENVDMAIVSSFLRLAKFTMFFSKTDFPDVLFLFTKNTAKPKRIHIRKRNIIFSPWAKSILPLDTVALRSLLRKDKYCNFPIRNLDPTPSSLTVPSNYFDMLLKPITQLIVTLRKEKREMSGIIKAGANGVIKIKATLLT